MTSETTTSTAKSRSNGGGGAADRDTIQTAVAEVRGAIDNLGRSVPEVARSTRAAAEDMFRAIESGSDERVSAGVTLSLGLAIGMLLGGAPRMLILLALAPVAAMGLVLQDRRKRASTRSTAAS